VSSVLVMVQVLNKVDLLTSAQLQQATEWLQGNTGAAAVLPISALSSNGVEHVRQWAVEHLPLGPTLYPKVCTVTWLGDQKQPGRNADVRLAKQIGNWFPAAAYLKASSLHVCRTAFQSRASGSL
jgi:hypothetical protein